MHRHLVVVYEVGSMDVGAGLYMYDVVVKSWRSLCHLLMSSCLKCSFSASLSDCWADTTWRRHTHT